MSIPSLFALTIMLAPAAAQNTTRVTWDHQGGEPDHHSYFSDIAVGARFLVFHSSATDHVPGDTNGKIDVFVRDRAAGRTTRVSVSSSGTEGNGDCRLAKISGDGRYVVFESESSNLVAGDTNGVSDVFLHDRHTGLTTRINLGPGAVQADASSGGPVINADGNWVVYSSNATNLVPGDVNGKHDLFRYELATGLTDLISRTPTEQANGTSTGPSLSFDGRVVAFHSSATNLVAGDTNGYDDMFVLELASGAISRVSVSTSGAQGNQHVVLGRISGDGMHVAFMSHATNLSGPDTNGESDVFVHDRLTAETVRVSVSSAGVPGNYRSLYPSISFDGRLVTFESYSNNLVYGDINVVPDMFLHDRMTHQTSLISRASSGAIGNEWSRDGSFSADARFVAFTSSADNLVSGDTNGVSDIFVRSLVLPGLDLVIAGTCPGPRIFTVSNASPGGSVALVHGRPGHFVRRSGACSGLELGLDDPLVGLILTADSSGSAAASLGIASSCGRSVAAIDLATCTASALVPL